ncbi:S8 family serine peptidase [Crossiella sp. CA198]|uniref:S8 family serine peptidase n=1 Tax=Crossiella sp. CA198 TaxID=3455607 RepID=UPI003F8D60D7
MPQVGAPEADLVVGKVLDDTGNGQLDEIIAGMLWAVREAVAKIVNMSLGGMPTDGTDPMSQAVNRLSREHGALFVITAGNDGRPGTVGAPGAADLALTMGSMTMAGGRSGFSSQGRRSEAGDLRARQRYRGRAG